MIMSVWQVTSRLESERDDVRQSVRGEFVATIENMVQVWNNS